VLVFVEDFVLKEELKQIQVMVSRTRSDLQKGQLKRCMEVLDSNAPGSEWLAEQKLKWSNVFLPIYRETIKVGKLDDSGDFKGFLKLQLLMQVVFWKSITSLVFSQYEYFVCRIRCNHVSSLSQCRVSITIRVAVLGVVLLLLTSTAFQFNLRMYNIVIHFAMGVG